MKKTKAVIIVCKECGRKNVVASPDVSCFWCGGKLAYSVQVR